MSKVWIFVGVIVGLLAVGWLLDLGQYFAAGAQWIEANRTISWAVFIVFYVVAVVAMLPGSLLTLAAGFLFGLGFGFAIVSFSSVVGASLAFLLGRYLARDWVEGQMASMPRFAALDAAVGQRGALVVLLTRLSPLFPFNLLNYALGLTQVRFLAYVAASWIGMMPGTVLYVYLGSVASDLPSLLAGEVDAGEFGGWLFYAGLAATLVLTLLITRMATKTLNQQLGDEG